MKSILEFVSTAVGFTAVLSALMLYFGYVRTQALFGYFGVPIGALGFSTTDYLLRSPDVLFRLVIWATLGLAVLAALAYGAGYAETKMSGIRRNAIRILLAALTGAAAAYAIASLLGVTPALPAAVALALSGALLLMQYDLYRRGPAFKPPAVLVVIGVLLVIGAAFWATSIQAQEFGVKAAQSFAASRHALDRAIIYSKEDLPLNGRQVLPQMRDNNSSWQFMFTGYKVLIFANERWFLIRDDWDQDTPTVILPANDKTIQVKVLPRQ